MFDYKFKYVYHQSEKEKKIQSVKTEYIKQLCSKCGHSMQFAMCQEKQICSWCGALNTNHTKGRFMYMMNKMLDRKYKTIRLGENENGKEKNNI